TMKTIGLLGGMSWESSIEYYRIINQAVRERLGGFHSARCVMYSVDFAEIETAQSQGKWDEVAAQLIDAARNIELAGADFLLICTNTMHKFSEQIQEQIDIPLLHIADATADAVRNAGIDTIALLGTRVTMEEDFIRGRLENQHNLRVLIPDKQEREIINHVIYQELVVGKIILSSKQKYIEIIDQLVGRGAQGVILGCTEIGLLVKADDVEIPIFDTAYIHALSSVNYALT
ncbi:MAG: aspartate/glutamate racemase family protein, partial [Chloroflexota bacterium]|nr:aspartate/glutamate racemase family protein [Chloroflexota bacterium]